ncbi:hypothetical protein NGRA_0995 [Nosema granulosis]|uniref:Uncharacterized protein n=1 Tax=Nosema granulosis TaxID=83296 RepID=A0A9P6GZ97_9MICR|nr:hypothetical protein NGRA_0995 [Nosema granulosis]
MAERKRQKIEGAGRNKSSKAARVEEAKQTLEFLIDSINNKEMSYISEFLCSSNKLITLKLLDDTQLNNLGLILVEFLDQPLRIQAIEVLKAIPFSMKDRKVFFDSVKSRVIDISKLLYLKGKLDYMKLTRLVTEKKEPKEKIHLKAE